MTASMVPDVTIVMPVYNVGPYIDECLTSLLSQTYSEFELLIFDDCSTDDTYVRVAAYSDRRIRLFRNEHNMGRAATDNRAIEYVRGRYLAKMDGDDICEPDRLALQVDFLERNPHINVVGSWITHFGASRFLQKEPALPEEVKVSTLFTLPVANNTPMFRSSLFTEQGLRYDEALRQSEDLDFFCRYIRQLRIHAIQRPLCHYRKFPVSHKQEIMAKRMEDANAIRQRLLDNWGIPYSLRQLKVHLALSNMGAQLKTVSLWEISAWMQRLIAHNKRIPLFEDAALRRVLGNRWFEACYNNVQPRMRSVRAYYASPLSTMWAAPMLSAAKLCGKSLVKI